MLGSIGWGILFTIIVILVAAKFLFQFSWKIYTIIVMVVLVIGGPGLANIPRFGGTAANYWNETKSVSSTINFVGQEFLIILNSTNSWDMQLAQTIETQQELDLEGADDLTKFAIAAGGWTIPFSVLLGIFVAIYYLMLMFFKWLARNKPIDDQQRLLKFFKLYSVIIAVVALWILTGGFNGIIALVKLYWTKLFGTP